MDRCGRFAADDFQVRQAPSRSIQHRPRRAGERQGGQQLGQERVITGSHAPVVGGALICALVLTSAAAVAFARTRPPQQVLLLGTGALVLVITLAAVALHFSVAFFAGTVLAGVGFGSGFNGSLRSLVGTATPAERGGLMSGFFVLSYLAFSVPALVAGLAAGSFGLHATALGFGLAVLALGLVALGLMLRRAAP
jgi:MFS family permease